MNFKLIKDLIVNDGFDEIVLYKKDTIFSPNDDGEYTFINQNGVEKKYNEQYLLDKDNLFESLPELDLVVGEVTDDDDNIIRNYRIQLDVKTSLKKLKLIENIFKETVNKII